MSAALWKGIAIGLLVLLLAVGGSTGFGWWLAARDRDQVKVDLKAEQIVTAGLRASIETQNSAVAGMAKEKEAADERRAAAEKLAAANGRRFDTALAKLSGATATTCADAMPAVNAMLEALR